MPSPAQPGKARRFKQARTIKPWRAMLARPDEDVRAYVVRAGAQARLSQSVPTSPKSW
jgi:hypothetical protein